MATHHGTIIEAFLQDAYGILQEIARRQCLPDARIDRRTESSAHLDLPVVTLTWSERHDNAVRHNVHVSVVRYAGRDGDVAELVAEVEINTWRDTETKINNKDGGVESVLRSIVHNSLPTIQNIDKRDQQRVREELVSALQQAYEATFKIQFVDLPRSSGEDRSHSEPGPIKLESWLAE
jgi:hypothetical protein